MNLKNLQIIKWVRREISIRRKTFVIKKEIKRRGRESINKEREERIKLIRMSKESIAKSLITSSDLKEIILPSESVYNDLKFFPKNLTIDYLKTLEKNCWNDIYKNQIK